MTPIKWLLRKTTHGYSETAHAFRQLEVSNWYAVSVCNPTTKYNSVKLIEVEDDYPKLCKMCMKELAVQVVGRMQGRDTDYKGWGDEQVESRLRKDPQYEY